MSYQLDIDEIPESKLRAELNRRNALRDAGLCDYCGRDGSTPNCKFPDRHGEAVFFLERQNRRASPADVRAILEKRCNQPPHLQQFRSGQ